jgi:hypothetical protein
MYFDASGTTRARWSDDTVYTTESTWEAASSETGSVWSNPLFVSTVTPDFSLQAGSPAINAGVDVGLTTDYVGNAIVGLPDIGAYEDQSSPAGCPVFVLSDSQLAACTGGSGTRYDITRAYFIAAGCTTGTIGDMDRCYTAAQGCGTGSYVDRWMCTLGVTGGMHGIMDYIRSTYGD